jgi:uncharacterized membrane protein
MDSNMLQLLRFIHIVAATLWVGTAVTLGFFVYPVLLNGDLANMRIIRQIMLGRKLATMMPVTMLLVVLSGAYLYWIDFPNMSMMHLDPRSLDYTLGAFFGIVALITGFSVNMPTGVRMTAVMDSIGAGNPTIEQTSEIARLSRKLIIATRCVAILAAGSAGLMALARYAR